MGLGKDWEEQARQHLMKDSGQIRSLAPLATPLQVAQRWKMGVQKVLTHDRSTDDWLTLGYR